MRIIPSQPYTIKPEMRTEIFNEFTAKFLCKTYGEFESDE